MDYALGCVRGESAQTLVPLESRQDDSPWFPHERADELITGRADTILAPPSLARHLDKNKRATDGKPLLYGWPVVVLSRAPRQIAPMFVVRVECSRRSDGAWRLTAEHEAEFNAAALARTPDSVSTADEIHALPLPYGDPEGMAQAASEAAAMMGHTPPMLDPDRLDCLDARAPVKDGVHNAAILLVAEFTQFRMLVEQDLHSLRDRTDWMETGAAWLVRQRTISTSRKPTTPLAAPLAANQSQAESLASIRTKPLTVVTGPPGTGKTQMVVNAVANAWLAGETVLLASTNNAAVDVAVRRADRDVQTGLLIRTGNQNVKQDVAQSVSFAFAQARKYAGPSSAVAVRALERTHHQLRGMLANVNKLEDLDRNLFRLTQDRSTEGAALVETVQSLELLPHRLSTPTDDVVTYACALARAARCAAKLKACSLQSGRRFSKPAVVQIRKNAERFLQYRSQSPVLKFFHRMALRRDLCKRAGCSSDTPVEQIHIWASAWLEEKSAAHQMREQAEANGFSAFTSGQLLNAIDSSQMLNMVMKMVQCLTTIEKESKSLREERDALHKSIGDNVAVENRENLDELSKRSLVAVQAKVVESLLGAKPGQCPEFGSVSPSSEPFSQAVAKALSVFPGWACTALSIKGSFPLRAGLFDLVIVDEASQCSLADILPLAYRAKRLAIVGDPNQLRAITTLGDRHLRLIAQDTGNDEDQLRNCGMHHKDGSAYEAFSSVSQVSPLMLEDHYRCHPRIAKWFNEAFYGGRLNVLTEVVGDAGGKSIVWKDVEGDSHRPRRGSGRGGWVNDAQAKATVELLASLAQQELTMGVVAPYAAQAELIDRMARGDIGDDLLSEVNFVSGTAHKLQGDERDIIIFASTLTPNMPARSAKWIEQERNLINVAVSRARRMLLVVGHPALEDSQQSKTLSELRKYIMDIEKNASGAVPVVAHSDAERLLLESMRRLGLKPIGKPDVEGFELDFAIMNGSFKLNVEVDGEHHVDAIGRQRRSDLARDELLGRLGWKVLRIPAWRCHSDPDSAAAEVKLALVKPS